MKKVFAFLLGYFACTVCAIAQSPPQNPSMYYGMVPTTGQWVNWFEQKQDYLGYVPFSNMGGTLTGKLWTSPSTTTVAGLNIGQGVAPTSPQNGDMWGTSSGLYIYFNNATYGPFGGSGYVTATQLAAGAAAGNLSLDMSGDATISSGAVLTINANAITNAKLANAAANTLVGNATGSSGNKTDLTVPSCSGATSALNWTSGSGIGCNTSLGAVLSFRNRLINGDFRINQYNGGASFPLGTGVFTYGFVDRWYGYATGASVTLQQVAGTGGIQYALQITGAASNTGVEVGQRIEATNIYDQEGQTVTLQAGIACSALTSVSWYAYYPGSLNSWGSRTQIATGTFTVSSTMTTYSSNISLPSNVTNGLEIAFNTGAMTSGTCTFQNAQLEPGSVATTFEKVPIATELLWSQRYYESLCLSSGVYGPAEAQGALNFWAYVKWSAQKQSTPTVSSTAGSTFQFISNSGTATGSGTPTFSNASQLGIIMKVTSSGLTGGNGGFLLDAGSGTSCVIANAEL